MSNDQLAPLFRGPEWFQRFAKGNSESQWQPIPSFSWTVGFYVILTLIALPVGGGMFYASKENISYSHRYDNFEPGISNTDRWERISVEGGHNSSVYLLTNKTMHGPVYVYYELTDFYQNHKRYVRSLSRAQMGGENIGSDSMQECDPFRFVDPEGNNDTRDPEDRVILPCGLVAHSLFNDTFTLVSNVDAEGNELDLVMEETGIATEWDRKWLYADIEPQNFNDIAERRGGGEINGTLKNDEHFMVWMRVGSLPDVRKLYGIIHQDIPKGAMLTFNITNRYNTYDFDGQKKLILSTSNWTGGRNEVTGIVYFVIGTCSAIACILILGLDLKSDRRPGDLHALSWNRNPVS